MDRADSGRHRVKEEGQGAVEGEGASNSAKGLGKGHGKRQLEGHGKRQGV